MHGRSKKGQRNKDVTADYLAGDLDDSRLDVTQRFNRRSKYFQANKTARTALLRVAEMEAAGDIDALPVGEVRQVHSLYVEVRHAGVSRLCVVRSTLSKVSETAVVVGDRVRFRDVRTGETAPDVQEGVIERIEPRKTILTRADSFDPRKQDPIIANADQMLIVVSLLLPRVKWGLIDRMLVAARAGGLAPVVCLNKADLARPGADKRVKERDAVDALAEAEVALSHLATLGVRSLRTSVNTGAGLDALRDLLRDRTTALAGHSGVGKSSLIRAVQPGLDIRVGDVSGYNHKGRHTTTSARLYELDFGGQVIDTPGVKLFGLWNVTADSLIEHFPDVSDGTAPAWRVESYEKILASLGA
jgi:ribosome biogenesis GTPase